MRVSGVATGRPMVFVHGYGCDQTVWRFVAPEFERDHRVVLFDHLGSGRSDVSAFSASRYATLEAYAEDLIAIALHLEVEGGVLVAHSVGASIGILADGMRPGLFSQLVLIAPSPRFVNEGEYVGGFEESDIQNLLETLASNPLGWSREMAPAIMRRPDRPELQQELTDHFCRTNPEVALSFARATFLADNRDDLPRVRARTLIIQCSEDFVAPVVVGAYVHRRIPDSQLLLLETAGHCPHMSEPGEVRRAIREFVT